MPHVAVRYLLIICESHFDLIIEFDFALGDFVVHLSQFLEEPKIGRGIMILASIAIFSALKLLSLSSIPSLVTLGVAVRFHWRQHGGSGVHSLPPGALLDNCLLHLRVPQQMTLTTVVCSSRK
jgi:hypothetical protein